MDIRKDKDFWNGFAIGLASTGIDGYEVTYVPGGYNNPVASEQIDNSSWWWNLTDNVEVKK